VSRLDELASLDRGFRRSFLDHDTLTAQLRGWASAFPDLVRLESAGTSLEGRDIWHLTIGPDPDRARPSVWVDGNMHACELAGSSVALAIAEDALRLHLQPDQALHGMPAHLAERIRGVLFHVLPRMSPDGAECVLRTGRYVRSAPRDRRPNQQHAHWSARDVDGDGLSLLMRVVDPAGEFVESREVSGVMLQRTLDDPPPYYRLFPEGVIENFDGHHVPRPSYLSDNEVDLNRNFPFAWKHEPEQAGAGAFPGSEPESRAVIELAHRHPEIFAWLNCHTFGGVFIRPLGDGPDSKMDEDDLALYREIGEWSERLTGYPMVSGFEEFLYKPDTPIYGDLSEYAFHQRGAIAYVVELWDIFKRIGMARPKKFVDYYSHISREEIIKLARWDRGENRGRIFRPWVKFHHEQLGEVEVGGIDPRFGLWNPPDELVGEICAAQSAAWMRVAALAPAVQVTRRARERDGEVTRLEVAVDNVGYLPTYVLSSAKKLPHNEPLSARATVIGGDCRLVDPGDALREIGHLEGWGRGLGSGETVLAYARSRGTTSRAVLTYAVQGHGTLELRIGSCRTGWIVHREEV
jgi:murein tripeptide amidase MpaA